MSNRICQLFEIKYPIVQAGMVWCSGWKLASAVSDAGGLGLIGSGSMYPDVLRQHIQECKAAGAEHFGVNVPLMYPDIDAHMKVIRDEGVNVVFTSAGNPKTYTKALQEDGITVVHVVSSKKFALKAQDAGVSAVVAEGFEAGGHNGREETTTLCLVPEVADAVEIPVIAAGGIADGRSMLATMVLGADGVQVGSRFVASIESSAHEVYKQLLTESDEGATTLTLKELAPVRLLHNGFFKQVQEAYAANAGREQLRELLGRGRAKRGMFEGDLENGELEIGQVVSRIKEIKSAKEILEDIIESYGAANGPALGGRFNF